MVLGRGGGDEEHRFSHLIQPIRDLTKNWDVDIAAQLEDYLEELEHISIEFDGGSKTMNFADAALLIQGSACVYSKKVEYLFSLVYQVLDLLASKKKLQAAATANREGQDNEATFAQRRDDDEEFLSLDDIPQQKTHTKKVQGDDVAAFNAVQVMPKTPLALVSLDETEKGDNPLLSVKGEVLGSRMDFNMNSCTVHSSGFLLLDLSHLAMLTTALALKETTIQTIGAPSTENTPEPTAMEAGSGSNTLVADDNAPAPLADIDMDDNEGPAGFDDPADDDDEKAAESEEIIERRQLRERRKLLFAAPQIQQTVDVWEPLDPHQSSKTPDKPFRKKKTFCLPPSLKAEASKKRKHEKDVPESSHHITPIADFCTKAYFSHASKFPSNPLKVTTCPEFEDMYWEEYKWRQQKLAQEKKLLIQLRRAPAAELAQDDEAEADDVPAADDNDDDDDGGGHFDYHIPEIEEGNFDPHKDNEDGNDGLRCGPMVSSYEELVRQHVDGYMASAQQYAQLTDLARRVTEWEDQLMPRLQEEEKRESFDIHKYGSRVMDRIKDSRPASNKENSSSPAVIPFRKVVEHQPPFQVCRTFLATLQLANTYNIEIIQPELPLNNSINSLKLKLLNTRRHHEDLEEYLAPSLV